MDFDIAWEELDSLAETDRFGSFQAFDRESGLASIQLIASWVRGGELLKWLHLEYLAVKCGRDSTMTSLRRVATKFFKLFFRGQGSKVHQRLVLFLTNLPNGRHLYHTWCKQPENASAHQLPDGMQGNDLMLMFLAALTCEHNVTCLNFSQHGPALCSQLVQYVTLEMVRSLDKGQPYFHSDGM